MRHHLSSGDRNESGQRVVMVNPQLFNVTHIDETTGSVTIDMGLSFEWHDTFLAQESNGVPYSTHPQIRRKLDPSVMPWPTDKQIGKGFYTLNRLMFLVWLTFLLLYIGSKMTIVGTYFFDPAWKIKGSSSMEIRRNITSVLDANAGHVHQFIQVIVSFPQTMNLKSFPLDEQEIKFELLSEHPSHSLKFVEDSSKISKIFSHGTAAWSIKEQDNGLIGEYDIGDTVGGSRVAYASARFSFKIKRNRLWYFTNVILVCFLVVLASFSSFRILPEGPETDVKDSSVLADRLGIVLTTWLLLISLKFVVNDRLPKVSYMTMLDWYMLLTHVIMVYTVFYFCYRRNIIEMAEGAAHGTYMHRFFSGMVDVSYVMRSLIFFWFSIHCLIVAILVYAH